MKNTCGGVNLIPSKHFLFSKTFSRRLEDVFSVTLFVFQDVFNTYLQYVFLKRLQDVFKTCLQDVLQLCLQDAFKTSWKTKKCYTEDVFSTSSPRRMFAGLCSKSSTLNVTKNKYHHRFFSRSSFMSWEELVSGIRQIGYFRNFKDQIVEFTTKF